MANSKQIEIDLSEGDKETLINRYVMEHMRDESWEVFMETCHDDFYNDNAHIDALANAVVNEMVNNILVEKVNAEKDKFYFF